MILILISEARILTFHQDHAENPHAESMSDGIFLSVVSNDLLFLAELSYSPMHLALGHPDFLEIRLGSSLNGFRELVEDVHRFMHPAPLMPHRAEFLLQRFRKASD